jgi:hypothetical protein
VHVGLAFCRETTREARQRQGAAIKRHTQLLKSLLVQLFHKINEHRSARSHRRILASQQGLRRSGRCKQHGGDLMTAARCGISSSTQQAPRKQGGRRVASHGGEDAGRCSTAGRGNTGACACSHGGGRAAPAHGQWKGISSYRAAASLKQIRREGRRQMGFNSGALGQGAGRRGEESFCA